MTRSPQFLVQYQALTQGVGFAELPRRTVLVVSGDDRAQFLQSFTTNDIKRLAIGGGCEAFVTSPQGKTLGHVFIYCEANQHLIQTTPGQAKTLIGHFERYVITEDVQFSDRSADFCTLLVAGSKVFELLASLSDSSPPKEYLAHTTAKIAGRLVVLCRVEYAGPLSCFVQTSANDAATVAAAITDAGATRCDNSAVESARLEAGFPLFGLDITAENFPQEVARDARAISFTKGCYLGQETVARIDAVGHVNRLLVGLTFSSDKVPGNGTTLLAGDQQVGQVTSAAWSPRLLAPLALAYVSRSQAKKGSQLISAVGNAEVVSLPLAAG